jgi:hypothetical protein
VGFEPTVPVKVLRISSAVQSTTLPPLRIHFRPGGELVEGSWTKRERDIAVKKQERKRGFNKFAQVGPAMRWFSTAQVRGSLPHRIRGNHNDPTVFPQPKVVRTRIILM